MRTTVPEVDIIRRLKRDDATVLRTIQRLYGPAITAGLRKAYHGALQDNDLDQILNDALFGLWKYRTRIDPEKGRVRALLFKIAKNRAADTLRDSSKFPEIRDTEFWGRLMRKNSPHTGRPVEKKVLEVLDALTAIYRAILWLDAAVNGVASSKAVARATGLPERHVPVYRQRARDGFKRKWEELRNEGDLEP